MQNTIIDNSINLMGSVNQTVNQFINQVSQLDPIARQTSW